MTRNLPSLVDRDAELSVIGGVLLKPELMPLLPDIDCYCFSDPNLGHVWGAMRNLEVAGAPIDEVTVMDQLERDGHSFVPPSTVAEAALRVPTADSVEYYAEVLRRHRVGRDVFAALGHVTAKLREGALDGREALVDAQAALARIDTGERDERGKTLGDIARDIVADLCRGSAPPAGIKTGLAELDRRTTGVPFGVPTLVLAPPGCGKTTLAMALCEGAEDCGDSPLVYTYEDGWNSFGLRAVARYSGVATEKIRAADFVQDEMRRVSRALQQVIKRRTVIVRASGMGVEDMVRDVRVRRLKHQGDGTTGQLVVVDYIQRMPLPSMFNGTKNDRIGEISRRLADLAASENIAVVINSQVGRQVAREQRAPILQDARDCGELENDSKLAIGLFRPGLYDKPRTGVEHGVAPPSVLELHILKNHNGAADCHVEVHWELATHHIRDCDPD